MINRSKIKLLKHFLSCLDFKKTRTIERSLRFIGMAILMTVVSGIFVACGDDDEGNDMTVIIDDNGNTNSGVRFVAIDEENFYINDVKYTVEK